MERAAVELLHLHEGTHVMAVGFGPGVGVAELARQLPRGLVAGSDPSTAMLGHARRRNRDAVAAGRVVLRQARAESIPWPDASFDAVVAVNCIQLWEPIDAGVGEVARVLPPQGSVVIITHRWAIERSTPVDEWIAAVTDLLRARGVTTAVERRRYRSGEAVAMCGTASG